MIGKKRERENVYSSNFVMDLNVNQLVGYGRLFFFRNGNGNLMGCEISITFYRF